MDRLKSLWTFLVQLANVWTVAAALVSLGLAGLMARFSSLEGAPWPIVILGFSLVLVFTGAGLLMVVAAVSSYWGIRSPLRGKLQREAKSQPNDGLHSGLADQVSSMQRERAATDTFRVVQADLGIREFRRAELDRLSVTQRGKLFASDPAMEFWWRGRRDNGSWAMVRLEGGTWFTHQELTGMSEEERNTALRGYGRGVIRQWYLDQLPNPKAD
jgi:hypothetical protein